MLNRLPTFMPPLADMLADIGNPSNKALAKALGVKTRTVQRWLRVGHAPRPVMLSVFWLTRWGHGLVHCEAHNAAVMHAQIARCLKDEVERLAATLNRLGRIAEFGSANDPAPGINSDASANSLLQVMDSHAWMFRTHVAGQSSPTTPPNPQPATGSPGGSSPGSTDPQTQQPRHSQAD